MSYSNFTGTGKFASFKVEAKVVPRKESRKVRHLRIRKKVYNYFSRFYYNAILRKYNLEKEKSLLCLNG